MSKIAFMLGRGLLQEFTGRARTVLVKSATAIQLRTARQHGYLSILAVELGLHPQQRFRKDFLRSGQTASTIYRSCLPTPALSTRST